ncbi:putative TLD domain protein [Trypanosoma brucei equiperdum]|uniref:Oxidation resistance protein 1 n=1 Tax=Trypanosoma brucei equiperdum TaxID=630700 RepID=A0A3L6KWT3_9TRYP|nr:putative TLD domain protein [Trypanosoma brucei equiperdum]
MSGRGGSRAQSPCMTPSRCFLTNPFKISPAQTPKTTYLMRILGESIRRSSNVVATVAATVVLLEDDGFSTNSELLMKWWRMLERCLGELAGVVNSCEENIREKDMRVLLALSHGFALAAQLSSLERRFLACLHRFAEVCEGAETVGAGDKLSGALSDITSLLKEEETILVAIRRQEANYIEKAIALQEEVFRVGEEGEPFFGKVEEPETRRTYLGSLWHALTAPFDDSEEVNNEQLVAADGGDWSQLISTFGSGGGASVCNWDDSMLLNSIVECAFASAEQQHTLLSERNFAVALFLFSTKCNVLEELVEVCFQLRLGNGGLFGFERLMYTDVSSQRERTVDWLSTILSPLREDVLHLELCDGNPKPPYFVAVVFLTLLWNTTYCMWKRGCIREAYEWLRVVDLGQLRRMAKAEDERGMRREISPESGVNSEAEDVGNVQEELKYTGSLSWDYIVHRAAGCPGPDRAKQVHRHSEVDFRHDRSGQLMWFVHHISCLRNACALALLCSTPHDVMYIISKFHHSRRWQWRQCVYFHESAKDAGTNLSAEFGVVDSKFEVLSLTNFIVENYLARRSVRMYHFRSPPSPRKAASSDTTIEGSVLHVCDELICSMSYGRFSGVKEMKEAMFSELFGACCEGEIDEETGGEATTEGDDGGQRRLNWLEVHVAKVAVAFARDFRGNIYFQNAWVGTERGARSEKHSGGGAEEASWSSVLPLVKGLHGSAAHPPMPTDAGGGNQPINACSQGATHHEFEKEPQGLLRHVSCMVPVRMTPPRVEHQAENERCTLWLPSRKGVGLLLLPEETDVNGEYDSFGEVALRLLVIACRYCDSMKLLPLHSRFSHHAVPEAGRVDAENNDHLGGWDSCHALLPSVVHELNVGLSLITDELRSSAGGDVLSVWHQQRDSSISRFRLNHLVSVTLHGLCSDALTSIELQMREESSVISARCTISQAVGAVQESDQVELTVIDSCSTPRDLLLDSSTRKSNELFMPSPASPFHLGDKRQSSSAFAPDLSFDFSAFNSETLYATKQLVRELTEREEKWRRATEDDSLPPNTEECGISVLPWGARKLLHDRLPLMWQFAPWRLIYGTRFHGYSYSNMINACQREVNNAKRDGKQPKMILLLELDMSAVCLEDVVTEEGNEKKGGFVIGVCMSHPLSLDNRRFYGGSTTFVFQIRIPPSPQEPAIRTFHATGRNEKFINCTPQRIAIGGGGGCSLFLSNSISSGSTAACVTFDSPPLTHWRDPSLPSLSAGPSTSDSVSSFDIRTVEVIVVGE